MRQIKKKIGAYLLSAALLTATLLPNTFLTAKAASVPPFATTQSFTVGSGTYCQQGISLLNGITAVLTYSANTYYLNTFSSTGTLIKNINLTDMMNTLRTAEECSIFSLSNGNIVVAYCCADSSATLIRGTETKMNAYFMILDQSGAKVVDEKQINLYSSGSSQTRYISMAQLKGGNIAFSYMLSDNQHYGTRVFKTDGTAVTSGEYITANTTSCYSANVSAGSDGGYMLVYNYYGTSFGNNYVIFNADGTVKKAETAISVPANSQCSSYVTTLSNGSYMDVVGDNTATAYLFNASGVSQGSFPLSSGVIGIGTFAIYKSTDYEGFCIPSTEYSSGEKTAEDNGQNWSGSQYLDLTYYDNSGNIVGTATKLDSGLACNNDFEYWDPSNHSLGGYYDTSCSPSFFLFSGYSEGVGVIKTDEPNFPTSSTTSVSGKLFDMSVPYGISLSQSTDKTFSSATAGYADQTPCSVTVNNTGTNATGNLTVALSGTNKDDFTLSKTSINSIAASGSDSFTVTPNTGLSVGTHTATVTVSGTNVSSKTFNVSFTVNDSYGISLSPSTDKVFVSATAGYGAQTPYSVTVSNTGTGATGDLTVALGGTNKNDFTLSKTSINSIAASGSDNFTVTPNTGLSVGAHTATVTVSGTNVSSKTFNVSFTVNSAPTYDISLSSSNITFGSATVGYTTPTPYTVAIINIGTGDASSLTATLSGTNKDDFTLSGISLDSIAAGATSAFTVTPNTGLSVGIHTATVTVNGDHGISKSLNVSFTVNDSYGISLSASTDKTFSSATAGYGAQTPYSVTVSNTGTGATGDLTVALSGADKNDFTLSKTLINSITASGSDSFTVTPNTGLSVGTHTATVTVSGTNVSSKTFDVSFTVNDSYSISLSPSTDKVFAFATAGYGAQTPYSVTVNNTGTGATGNLTIALSGADKNDFTLSKTLISSIAASGSDSFTVTPNTGLSVGTHTATVTVSGTNVSSKTFDVTFTVNDSYSISLSPSTDKVFASVAAGYGAQTPYSVSVSNTGTGATGSLTVSLSGTNKDDFNLSKTSISSIAAGATSTFTVTPKTGLSVGSHTAIVTVSGTNVVSMSFNVSFTVTDSYSISLSHTGTYTLSSATVGYTAQAPYSVTVSNTGTSLVSNLTVALSGTNKDSFTLSKTSIGSLAAGASDSFTVTPKAGLSAGIYTATITVSGDHSISRTFDISFTVNPSPSGGGTGGSSGNSGKTDNTIGGTTGSSGATVITTPDGGTGIKIAPADTNTSSFNNVIVNVGSVSVTGPASLFSGAIGSDSSSWLVLSQNPTAPTTQTSMTIVAQSSGVTPVAVLDVDLTRYYSNGTSEPVHQLSGSATVTITLTAAQIAQITNSAHSQLLYYDPITGLLTDMNAVFDLTKGTATFTTGHFSTFVIATSSAVKPASGSITLDTRSYTMSPKNIYDIGVKLENAQNVTVKVYSSIGSVASVTKLKNGNYRVTGLKQGTTFIVFEIYDKNGKLLNHASTKVTITNGAKPHGDAVRAKSVF